MKRIFVYGILQKEQSADDFGIKDEYYLGRATLYGYSRDGLTRIIKSKRDDDYVCGDIYSVNNDLEEKLYKFESQFGYKREKTYPMTIKDGKTFECISYIV